MKLPATDRAMTADKIKLWFFRDLSHHERLRLFGIFGMPVDELGTHGTQAIALNHILTALSLGEKP